MTPPEAGGRRGQCRGPASSTQVEASAVAPADTTPPKLPVTQMYKPRPREDKKLAPGPAESLKQQGSQVKTPGSHTHVSSLA